MASNFRRTPPDSSNLNCHSHTSFSKVPVSYPGYSVYEKAIGKEFLPVHNLNSKINHLSYKRESFARVTPLQENSRVLSQANLNRMSSNPCLQDGGMPFQYSEDSTDKEVLEKKNYATDKRFSDHCYLSKHHETKGRSSNTGNFSTNFSSGTVNRVENGITITAWLDSYGSKNHLSTGYNGGFDEPGSTKDNSVIENNLASNHTFLKNLEDLTVILNDSGKAHTVQSRHVNIDKSSGLVARDKHSSRGNQGNIVGQHRENMPYYVSQAAKRIPEDPQLDKGRSVSVMQTRRGSDLTRDTYQNSQREVGTARRQEAERNQMIRNPSYKDSIRIENNIQHVQQSQPKARAENTARGNIDEGSKSIPIQRILKDALNSGYPSSNNYRLENPPLNVIPQQVTNRLNYGQIRLVEPTIEGFTGSQTKRRSGGGGTTAASGATHQKPYWQVKKTSAKIEASKKSLVNSLMKNNYFLPGNNGLNSIEASKAANIPVKGGHGHKRSCTNPEGAFKQFPVKSSDPYFASNEGATLRNGGKQPNHVGLEDYNQANIYNSYIDGKNGGKKDSKSLETKRGLSGKLFFKMGDEPEKGVTARRSSNKQGENGIQALKNFEPKLKNFYVKDKAMERRERNELAFEETMKKVDCEQSPNVVPQLLRGRSMAKYREPMTEDSFANDVSSLSFDIKNQAGSKSFTYLKPDQARPFSESRSNSKDILSSLKDFSYNIVKSTKEFFLHKYGDQRPRTKCQCASYLKSNDETCPKAQKWLFSKYKEFELEYLKKTYEKIRDNPDIDPKCQKQIGLDIRRTNPECEFFVNEGEGVQSLERVLQCFSKYDPKIGYVQGMNFIAASILYHAEEYITFWILVLIFEKAEMRDVYMQDLPGLTKHSQIVDFLILNNLPELYSHFCTHHIIVEMFCTEWICGLFGTVIPVEKMDCFLEGFVAYGWLFFYKFVLALLKNFEKELREATDMSDILVVFKSGINRRERNVAAGTREKVDWDKIAKCAYQIQLDSSFIHKMLSVFDQETKRFILNPKS